MTKKRLKIVAGDEFVVGSKSHFSLPQLFILSSFIQ